MLEGRFPLPPYAELIGVRPIAVGELVEVEGETVRQGRRIGFAEARAVRGGELAASASATMTVQRISA